MAAAVSGQVTGAYKGTPDLGAAEMAIISTSEAAEEETVISDTNFAESTTISG